MTVLTGNCALPQSVVDSGRVKILRMYLGGFTIHCVKLSEAILVMLYKVLENFSIELEGKKYNL